MALSNGHRSCHTDTLLYRNCHIVTLTDDQIKNHMSFERYIHSPKTQNTYIFKGFHLLFKIPVEALNIY